MCVAFLGGPPCNTWSAARQHALAGGKGPRVIGRGEAPWGLGFLRRGELLQIIEHNQLSGFSLESMATLVTTSGVGLLEHPAQPDDPSAASIWAQPILRLISDLPGTRLVRVNQGFHGAASMKPTDLLALNVPSLEKCLSEWKVTQMVPGHLSIGQDDQGRFRTTPLKEYPSPSPCGSFAHSLLTSIDQFEVDYSLSPPSAFVEACDTACHRVWGLYRT
eukprot:Skav217728  [mRNA]  locus=scaffold1282:35713:36369:+ [translate_table: standard]